MSTFNFPLAEFPESTKKLREEVRAFLADEIANGTFRPRSDFGAKDDPEFSRKMGQRSWLGMTWPKKYGGHERSMLERYVVTEEMLAIAGEHLWRQRRHVVPAIVLIKLVKAVHVIKVVKVILLVRPVPVIESLTKAHGLLEQPPLILKESITCHGAKIRALR